LDAFIAKRRPPPHIRPKLDFGYRISGHSVEIFEIRPVWRGEPGEKMEHSVAKATFVRTREVWRIFWMRQDLKWHGYEPAAEVGTINAFCRIVDEDKYCCFFG
ncbi:MAG: DUF3024 domain-containing protein, partial [Methyloceanibacter sp.]